MRSTVHPEPRSITRPHATQDAGMFSVRTLAAGCARARAAGLIDVQLRGNFALSPASRMATSHSVAFGLAPSASPGPTQRQSRRRSEH